MRRAGGRAERAGGQDGRTQDTQKYSGRNGATQDDKARRSLISCPIRLLCLVLLPLVKDLTVCGGRWLYQRWRYLSVCLVFALRLMCSFAWLFVDFFLRRAGGRTGGRSGRAKRDDTGHAKRHRTTRGDTGCQSKAQDTRNDTGRHRTLACSLAF